MGIVAKFRKQRAWARNGVVHVTDDDTGEDTTMSYLEFTKGRIMGLVHMRNTAKTPGERAEFQRAISDMAEVALEARLQGDPLKPLTPAQRKLQLAQAKDRAKEKLADLQKIVTLDEAQLATAHSMAEQGYAPSLIDQHGNKLV